MFAEPLDMTARQMQIGDTAIDYMEHGETLRSFARRTGLSLTAVSEYRAMALFWTPGLRMYVSGRWPEASYSLMREAARVRLMADASDDNNLVRALLFVQRGVEHDWSYKQAAAVMRRWINLTQYHTGSDLSHQAAAVRRVVDDAEKRDALIGETLAQVIDVYGKTVLLALHTMDADRLPSDKWLTVQLWGKR